MRTGQGDERAALLARTKELAAAGEGGRGGRQRGRGSAAPGPPGRARTWSRTARRPAARTTTWCCARSATSPTSTSPRDHLELGELLGAIDTERGREGVGQPVLLPHRRRARCCSSGCCSWPSQQAVEYGFTPVITPVLVKPESMEGTGFLGAHASEIYRLEADDLYLVGTSEVPLAAYHGNEILDLPAGAAAALRRLVVVLPARGRLVRQGHARHHPGAPVRQGRDVLVLPARGGRTTSTCGCSPGKRRCWPRSRCRTG